jgi:hypothetical protein
MKKQNLFLLINLGIMLVIGLAYIMINQNVGLNDDEDKLFGQNVDLINGEKLEEIPFMSEASRNFQLIDYKWIAVDKDEDVVGTVYRVVIKNDFPFVGSDLDYGYMEFLVGITTNNEVLVQYVTIYQSNWAVVGIQKYIQDYYNGINYLSVNNVPSFDADIVSGATENPATVSTDTIKTAIQEVIVLHYNLFEEDPYVDIFGIMNYEFSIDDTFDPTEHITSKRLIKSETDDLGYVYSITGRGEYQEGVYDTIVIEIIFDMNDVIVGEKTGKWCRKGFETEGKAERQEPKGRDREKGEDLRGRTEKTSGAGAQSATERWPSTHPVIPGQ